jgi:flagellar hook assembly protein FlgD
LVRYSLPEPAKVELKVYNILGQPVRRLVELARAAGHHSMMWDGRDDTGAILPAGIYLIILRAGTFSHTVKAVLLKN